MAARIPWWRRVFRWLLAAAMVPWIVGNAVALGRIAALNGTAVGFWVPLAAGALAWLVIFLSLPRPLWIYVMGHELTHVIWGWLFGARVRGFRVGARGGMVRLTRSNSLIALSPYFFPLYAVLWSVAFPIVAWLAGLADPSPWYLLGLGVCYAFHVTLTGHVLRVRQPDLEGEGWIFSAALIALGNTLVALVGLGILAPRPGLLMALGWAWSEGWAMVGVAGSALGRW